MPSLKVRCCTWNVGDQGPPKDDLKTLLNLDDSDLPDIIAVALQEVEEAEDWRKRLLEHTHPAGYVLVKSRYCWAIGMLVFARRSLLPAITNTESEVTASGYAGIMGNKGGVSVRFEICGVNVVFLSCHFAAHKDKNKDRVNDYKDIVDNQSFRDDDVHSVLDHDYVFWMGDLNFRLENTDKATAEKLIRQKQYSTLLARDQLLINKKKQLIFEDFQEGEITFAPTFKFDKGTDRYDSSAKQRIPAWTDRILYMAHRDFATDFYSSVIRHTRTQNTSRHTPIRGAPSEVEQNSQASDKIGSIGSQQPEIKLLEYTSLTNYKWSDHRPVVGSFRVVVPQKWFSLPISFLEPLARDYPYDKDLDFQYKLMNPPALLRMSESDTLLSTRPVVPTVDFINLMLISTMGKLSLPTQSGTASDPSAPAVLEQDMGDWIGVYPADFASLEKGYVTYVKAPSENLYITRDVYAAATKQSIAPTFGGKILARYLSELRNHSVQLIYWSKKKNCPQGYSPIFKLKG
ncbi:hypothetical protein P879_02556 [Paragonimus westermani]|uniref:Inositol polyphosphate-related phosphatase domain-containing protein n=2 Tax=Paragonimus westermani TaxID=34504 RepID=A0A8T0D6C1_9TREM|nr:hypothetical protein P879_02556 [Paragonimus westermani]